MAEAVEQRRERLIAIAEQQVLQVGACVGGVKLKQIELVSGIVCSCLPASACTFQQARSQAKLSHTP